MIHEPNPLTREQKDRIVKAARYCAKGGSIGCGHDFWNHARNKPGGDIFLCTRCYQYFVKMNGLPWWNEGHEYGEFTADPRSNHMDGAWFHPVDIRFQDQHGNTISN